MYADNTMYPKAKESDKHIISIIRVNNSRNNRKAPEGKNWEGEHRSALQRWKKRKKMEDNLTHYNITVGGLGKKIPRAVTSVASNKAFDW